MWQIKNDESDLVVQVHDYKFLHTWNEWTRTRTSAFVNESVILHIKMQFLSKWDVIDSNRVTITQEIFPTPKFCVCC